jgi:hypothetical protein
LNGPKDIAVDSVGDSYFSSFVITIVVLTLPFST